MFEKYATLERRPEGRGLKPVIDGQGMNPTVAAFDREVRKDESLYIEIIK